MGKFLAGITCAATAAVVIAGCAPSTEPNIKDPNVLATVNGHPITVSDFKKAADKQMPYRRIDLSLMEKKLELLNYLIDNELIFQEALKQNIHRDPEIRGMIIAKFLKKNIPFNEKPSEREIRKYFSRHKDELEKVRVSHILIKAGEDRSDKKALEIIKKIQKKLKKGEDFAKLAKEYSEDKATAQNGGDLGYISRTDRLVPEFIKASFALKKKGDISKPVKTVFGYHLIKLTGDKRGLKKFKRKIAEILSKNKRKEKYKKLINSLRAKASIEKNITALEKFEAPKSKPLIEIEKELKKRKMKK